MADNRKLLAVMFTDIVGYTSMTAKDESYSIDLVESINKKLRTYICRQHGKWVQQVGDGTLSTFKSAYDALVCAVRIQQKFFNNPKVNLRIGIHIGDIVVREPNVWGSGVNIASRIEGFAKNGEIVVSQSVKDALSSHPEFNFSSLGNHEFKGVPQPIEVFAISAVNTELREIEITQKQRQFKFVFHGVLALVVCTFLLLVYFFIPFENEKTITFSVIGLPDDGGSERQNYLLNEIKRDLFKATGLPVKLVDNSPVSVEFSSESVALNSPGDRYTFPSLDKAYANLQKISQGVVRAQDIFEDAEKRNLILYLDVYKEIYSLGTLNDIENLITKSNSLIRLDPENINYQSMLCRALIGREVLRHSSVKKIREVSSEKCLSLLNQNIDNVNAIMALTDYYIHIKEFEFAESFLTKINKDQYEWYWLKSRIYYKQNLLQEAKKVLLDFIKQFDFQNVVVQSFMGAIEYELGNLIESKRILEGVMASGQEIFFAKKYLAVIYFALGDLEESNKFFTEVNAAFPSAEALMNHGTALYYLGRFEDSAAAYKKALITFPDDYLLIGNYADALNEFSDNSSEVANLYSRAVELAGNLIVNGAKDAFILLDMAHYFSQLGRFTQADEYFEQFNIQVPDSEQYYYYKAVSFSKRGDKSAASEYIKRALDGGFPQLYITNTPILDDII